MKTSVRQAAVDCVLDLGVTVVYAAVVGVLIAGIVALDNGPASLPRTLLYTSLLPISVMILILFDLALRIAADARAAGRRHR